jgi:hypothetical protein
MFDNSFRPIRSPKKVPQWRNRKCLCVLSCSGQVFYISVVKLQIIELRSVACAVGSQKARATADQIILNLCRVYVCVCVGGSYIISWRMRIKRGMEISCYWISCYCFVNVHCYVFLEGKSISFWLADDAWRFSLTRGNNYLSVSLSVEFRHLNYKQVMAIDLYHAGVTFKKKLFYRGKKFTVKCVILIIVKLWSFV